jgi:hypothetical protein
LAVANYHDTEGHFPPPYLTDKDGPPIHSWRVLILPYIEGDHLYKKYDFREPWDGPNNSQIAERMPKIFALHGDYKPGDTTANYLAIVGSNTVWRPEKPVRYDDVTDGTSVTILIVENRGMNIHWTEPRDLSFDTMDWTIDSPLGISSKYHSPAVVMLDGSVRTLSKKLTPDALRAMATIAGGEKLTEEFELTEELPDGRDRPVSKP